MTESSGAAEFKIQTRWPDNAASSAVLVNQFAVAPGAGTASGAHEGGVYLIVGHVAPPMLSSAEDVARFMESGGNTPIDVRGAYYLTHARARELYGALGVQLKLAGVDLADAEANLEHHSRTGEVGPVSA